MDRAGADFFRCVSMIKDRLKCRPVLLNLPIGIEDTFKEVVDLVEMRAIVYEDDQLGAKYSFRNPCGDEGRRAEITHNDLVEVAAENDESLREVPRWRKPLSIEEIRRGLRKACLAMTAVPVLCGSAFKNKRCSAIA